MNPVVPDKDSIIECDRLPEFEEIEINGSHDVKSCEDDTSGAGPGGCDSSQW